MIVAGKWDDEGGRPSGYMRKFITSFEAYFCCDGSSADNGGYWNVLRDEIMQEIEDDDVTLWFPEVPNSKEKLVSEIKKKNPKSILVTSKNNDSGKYSFIQLAAHALKNKANLFIEFKRKDGKVIASLYDPLGNCFCKDEEDVDKVAYALSKRISYIIGMTRIGSFNVGGNVETPRPLNQFTDIITKSADTFHDLVHGANPSRFMGNCSFRCTIGGFPSFRSGPYIFVSKRNIDKRELGPDGFVAVQPTTMYDYINGNLQVKYFGDNKPSVDTPIQLALYALYPNINYMIHSHVYIEGVEFTDNVVPCGAMQEVEEIMKVVRENHVNEFRVNLRGHGSIAAGDDCYTLEDIPYKARVFPESHKI